MKQEVDLELAEEKWVCNVLKRSFSVDDFRRLASANQILMASSGPTSPLLLHGPVTGEFP